MTRAHHEPQRLVPREPLPGLRRHEVREIALAALDEAEALRVVGNHRELGVREGARRAPVVGVAREAKARARRPALERVGPRAHDGHRCLRELVGRQHEAPREPRQQGGIRPHGAHLDPPLVERAHAVDRAQVAEVRPAQPRPGQQAGRHVARRGRASVREAQPGPEREHEGAVVRREPGLGQRRNDVQAAIESDRGEAASGSSRRCSSRWRPAGSGRSR